MSAFIDLTIVYGFFITLYYVVPSFYNMQFNLGSIYKLTFLFSLIYETFYHIKHQQTLGEKFIGLKVILNNPGLNTVKYFMRAFLRSTVFVPLVYSFTSLSGAIILIVFSLVIQFIPEIGRKRIFVWDIAIHASVIDCRLR
jgi:uncharacterized RDD family membrane protein YckC